ncbi:MAG: TPM domain-containing protein [Nevskiaceae bacterium]|jgi:uncharacterized membrane protein|nr:TPM domain-containing protein [Nevskiaceae bacterium]
MILRALRHLFTPFWIAPRRFGAPLLAQIAQRIADAEQRRPGELRFVVEHALDIGDVLFRRVTPRQRALELFSLLRVWDTEHNTGILIHVLLADRAVEIVADRGIAARVPQPQWDLLCRNAQTAFREQRYAEGSLALIDGAARLLESSFPASLPKKPNELPDQPLLL